jgi:hypothetical protein
MALVAHEGVHNVLMTVGASLCLVGSLVATLVAMATSNYMDLSHSESQATPGIGAIACVGLSIILLIALGTAAHADRSDPVLTPF